MKELQVENINKDKKVFILVEEKRCTNCGLFPFCEYIPNMGYIPGCDNRWVKKELPSNTKLESRQGEVYNFKRLS